MFFPLYHALTDFWPHLKIGRDNRPYAPISKVRLVEPTINSDGALLIFKVAYFLTLFQGANTKLSFQNHSHYCHRHLYYLHL